MSKIGFGMAMVMVIVGFVLECVGPLVKAVVPIIARMVSVVTTGRFVSSDFVPSLVVYHTMAGILLALGIILSIAFYIAGVRQGKQSG